MKCTYPSLGRLNRKADFNILSGHWKFQLLVVLSFWNNSLKILTIYFCNWYDRETKQNLDLQFCYQGHLESKIFGNYYLIYYFHYLTKTISGRKPPLIFYMHPIACAKKTNARQILGLQINLSFLMLSLSQQWALLTFIYIIFFSFPFRGF